MCLNRQGISRVFKHLGQAEIKTLRFLSMKFQYQEITLGLISMETALILWTKIASLELWCRSEMIYF